MGSQFVDFNGDGQVDILTATFDGSPHISFGSKDGFGKPEHLFDAQGERILITSFWNYKDAQHQETGRSLDTKTPPKERCISALAYDWDGDGDYDLLLGSYENGHLYRQMNEGSNAKPAFTGKNITVMAGDQALAIPAKMTAPRLIDWDSDGDLDIIAGSFGASYGKGAGGAVYLYRNLGKKGKPAFAAAEILITQSSKGQSSPTRPDAGLYVDAADFDGDGDLDLIVGGYSMWTPQGPNLTEEDKARASTLTQEKARLQKKSLLLYREINKEIMAATEGMDRKSKEYRTKASTIRASYKERTAPIAAEAASVRKKLEKLHPSSQRKAFVWLYERK